MSEITARDCEDGYVDGVITVPSISDAIYGGIHTADGITFKILEIEGYYPSSDGYYARFIGELIK